MLRTLKPPENPCCPSLTTSWRLVQRCWCRYSCASSLLEILKLLARGTYRDPNCGLDCRLQPGGLCCVFSSWWFRWKPFWIQAWNFRSPPDWQICYPPSVCLVVLELKRYRCGYLPFVVALAVDTSVDRVVPVHNIYGITFDRESDVYHTTTTVSWYQVLVSCTSFILIYCIQLFLLLADFSIFVVQAVLTVISKSGTVPPSFWIIDTAFRVLKAISFFNGCYYRSAFVSSYVFGWDAHRLLRDCTLDIQSVSPVNLPAQCILDLDALCVILRLNQSI